MDPWLRSGMMTRHMAITGFMKQYDSPALSHSRYETTASSWTNPYYQSDLTCATWNATKLGHYTCIMRCTIIEGGVFHNVQPALVKFAFKNPKYGTDVCSSPPPPPPHTHPSNQRVPGKDIPPISGVVYHWLLQKKKKKIPGFLGKFPLRLRPQIPPGNVYSGGGGSAP